VRRILEVKLRYLKANSAVKGSGSVPYIPDLARVEAEIPDAEGSQFFMNLAARSVTIVKPAQGNAVFPVTKENSGRVLLAGRYGDFFTYGKAAFPDASTFRYNADWGVTELVSNARYADTVIFCLSDAIDLRMLRSLEALNKKVIVLSVLSPVHIESVPWVSGAVAVYSYAPESFASGFAAIIGRIPADGSLPYER
jgi:beta-N-acetylhexosaminidase